MSTRMSYRSVIFETHQLQWTLYSIQSNFVKQKPKNQEEPHLLSSAHVVERVATRKISAQLMVQSATSVNTRETIVHNTLQNQLWQQLRCKNLAMVVPCTLIP